MALAYILGGGIKVEPGIGIDLHDRYDRAKATYRDVSEWTGLEVSQILREGLPGATELRKGIGGIRQAAAILATYDVLADHGVHPGVVSGLSLGSMIGACLAGALDRADLFGFLMHYREVPSLPEGSRPQGIVALTLPPDADFGWYYQLGDRGVYVLADMGPVFGGQKHVLMLSGYYDALTDLAAELPADCVPRPPEPELAFHSPLQQHVVDHLKAYIDAMPLRDPLLPLCSSLAPEVLTTAEQVREVFRRNPVDPVSVVHMRTGLERFDAELGLVLGPSQFDRFMLSPFPVVHVATPEQVVEAITAIHDLGVELLPAPAEAGKR